MKTRIFLSIVLAFGLFLSGCGQEQAPEESQEAQSDSSKFSIEMSEIEEEAPFADQEKEDSESEKEEKDESGEEEEEEEEEEEKERTMEEKAALGAALADADCKEEEVEVQELTYNEEKERYDLAFIHEDTKYTYRVSKEGDILRKDFTRVGYEKEKNVTEEFLEKAFKDAGAKSLEEIGPYEYKIVQEDGKPVYEIQFSFQGKSHHYKINGETGELLERTQEKAEDGESLDEGGEVILVKPGRK